MKINYLWNQIRKNQKAFTLVEVLLTLTIIGIVAALVIPILIADLQKARTKALIKENFTIVNQAVTSLIADNGGDLTNVYANQCTFMSALSTKLNVAKDCSAGSNLPPCPSPYTYDTTYKYLTQDNYMEVRSGGNGFPILFLSNGAMLIVAGWYPKCDSACGTLPMTKCASLFIDINGWNEPDNIVGSDVFPVYIMPKTSILPSGTGTANFGGDCTDVANTTGASCTQYYLYN